MYHRQPHNIKDLFLLCLRYSIGISIVLIAIIFMIFVGISRAIFNSLVVWLEKNFPQHYSVNYKLSKEDMRNLQHGNTVKLKGIIDEWIEKIVDGRIG